MRLKYGIVLFILVASVFLLLVLSLSINLLPDAPISPTATFPESIDFPNGRDVPSR